MVKTRFPSMNTRESNTLIDRNFPSKFLFRSFSSPLSRLPLHCSSISEIYKITTRKHFLSLSLSKIYSLLFRIFSVNFDDLPFLWAKYISSIAANTKALFISASFQWFAISPKSSTVHRYFFF